MGFFKKVDPFVQRLSGWITVGGIVLTGLYSVIVLASPVFAGLHWTEVVLLGIVLSLATLLMLAVIAAVFAWVGRQIWPAPANAVAEELERTKERLKRAEERLDGARVVEAVGTASGSKADSRPRLTEAERERVSIALSEVVDFIGVNVTPFYSALGDACSGGPWNIVRQAEGLEPAREALDRAAGELWHKHSYYLDLVGLDIMPLLQTLGALRNPLLDAAEAELWPVNAQADRARPVAQLMSDLGGHMGNIQQEARAKRKEYLE